MKKLLALLLALVMVLSMVACGAKTEPADKAEDAPAADAPAADAPAAPKEEEPSETIEPATTDPSTATTMPEEPIEEEAPPQKNFREEAGSVYSTTAKPSDAQALLQQAGVTSGKFAITYRTDRAYDAKVAEYAKGVWEALGFTVTLKGLELDAYETALYEGDFDVIALDYQTLSTNAYSALAPFAHEYSGSVVSVGINSSGIAPHVTGFVSEAYSKLLDEILLETEREDRVKKLIELEKLLAEECPAVAMTFYVNNYLASSEMKDLETNRYGVVDFTNATLKKYQEKNEAYLAAQEAKKQAEKEQAK